MYEGFKEVHNALGFMNVILLHSNHRFVHCADYITTQQSRSRITTCFFYAHFFQNDISHKNSLYFYTWTFCNLNWKF